VHCGAGLSGVTAAQDARDEEMTGRMQKRLKAAPFQSISQIDGEFNF
jgi:hypothetical protein